MDFRLYALLPKLWMIEGLKNQIIVLFAEGGNAGSKKNDKGYALIALSNLRLSTVGMVLITLPFKLSLDFTHIGFCTVLYFSANESCHVM